MSDAVIELRHVTKKYRLYSQPFDRFLDLLGWLPNTPGRFSEHTALNNVSFRVGRGEKVAVIGRNGAGKSTMLKLVTQVTAPTSGEVLLRGDVHALLQLGSGFHPEFSGRQNAYSHLAQYGIGGRQADRIIDDIAAFAELGEYLDQPMKTYSSGMTVRLMFAASTVLSPDVLILDEVLGVGDAYFQQKSYNRVRDLCESNGTTVLLVSHDIYTASKICPRMIWVDRGSVVMDADSPTVIAAYEDSIRAQEEERLRRRKFDRIQQLANEAEEAKKQREPKLPAMIEICAAGSRPQPCSAHFSRIALTWGDAVAALPLDREVGPSADESHLQDEGSCWGPITVWQDRTTRALQNFGSSFQKVAGVAFLPEHLKSSDVAALRLRLDYWMDEPCELLLRLHWQGKAYDLGMLPQVCAAWATYEATPNSEQLCGPVDVERTNMSGVHGTGVIGLSELRLLDPNGSETFFLKHGEPLELMVDYDIRDASFNGTAQVIVALHRDGVQDVCRLLTRDLHFDAATQPQGTIRLQWPKLTLSDGTYTATVLMAKAGYYDREQTIFYSANPEVYCCLARLLEFNVSGTPRWGSGTMSCQEGRWSLIPRDATAVMPNKECKRNVQAA